MIGTDFTLFGTLRRDYVKTNWQIKYSLISNNLHTRYHRREARREVRYTNGVRIVLFVAIAIKQIVSTHRCDRLWSSVRGGNKWELQLRSMEISLSLECKYRDWWWRVDGQILQRTLLVFANKNIDWQSIGAWKILRRESGDLTPQVSPHTLHLIWFDQYTN